MFTSRCAYIPLIEMRRWVNVSDQITVLHDTAFVHEKLALIGWKFKEEIVRSLIQSHGLAIDRVQVLARQDGRRASTIERTTSVTWCFRCFCRRDRERKWVTLNVKTQRLNQTLMVTSIINSEGDSSSDGSDSGSEEVRARVASRQSAGESSTAEGWREVYPPEEARESVEFHIRNTEPRLAPPWNSDPIM